jgi:hypothetical protein
MKRFLVFAGGDYYPGGGWLDFVTSFDNFAVASGSAQGLVKPHDWAQVVDTETGVVTYFDTRYPHGRTYP